MVGEDFSQSSNAEDSEEQIAGPQTAGSVLKAKRVGLEMSEKTVADKLHITMHYVRSIEADCYEKLPGKVFAKGYIKSYAQLLKLNEDDILGLFEDFYLQQQESEEESRQKEKKARDRNKPWLILSAIIFIGGFAALWFFNKYVGDDEVVGATSSPAFSAEPNQRSLEAEVLEVETVPETEDVSPDVIQQVAENNVDDSQAMFSALADAIATAPGFADSASPESIAGENASEAVPQSLITVDAGGSDKLELSFSGESWVEVTDVDSNQVFRDIREAGDVVEISGNAPFNVLLGDAPFASMSLNGEAVDVSANIRIDNSARLIVGP